MMITGNNYELKLLDKKKRKNMGKLLIIIFAWLNSEMLL